jgi:hypothetical protein
LATGVRPHHQADRGKARLVSPQPLVKAKHDQVASSGLSQGVTAAGGPASPLSAPGRACGLAGRQRALPTDGAELGRVPDPGHLGIVTFMDEVARRSRLIRGPVTAVTGSVVCCDSEELVQAPEPRLAIDLVPVSEVGQEARDRIGRLRPEARCGRGTLEGRAKGLHLGPGQGMACRESAIIRHGTHDSGEAHRGRAPRSMPAMVGVCIGARSPSRSAAFWKDDHVSGPRSVSTTIPMVTKIAAGLFPMAAITMERAWRSAAGSVGRAARDDVGSFVDSVVIG